MHLLWANASFAGGGVLIKLAPMIRLMPVAIEKNAVAEGMSRMRRKEVKSTLQYEPGLSSVTRPHYGDSRALLEYSHRC